MRQFEPCVRRIWFEIADQGNSLCAGATKREADTLVRLRVARRTPDKGVDRSYTSHLTQEDLQAIVAAHQVERSPDPATLLSLIRSWRSSPEWAALAVGTRRTWGSALDRIEAKWGDAPLAVWNDPRMVGKVVAWRDTRAQTPRAADIGVTVLRALLEHGRLRGRIAINVAANIPQLYKNGGRANIIWTAEDIARFKSTAQQLGQSHVSDGLSLAALTGLRRADLVTLTWDQVGEFAIIKKALKPSAGKRRHMTMPRIPALNSLLEELRTRPRRAGVRRCWSIAMARLGVAMGSEEASTGSATRRA